MSARTYQDGVLVEYRDDTALTVTVYNDDGTVASSRPFTADEITAARAAAFERAMITDLEARVIALEAVVFKVAPPGQTAPAWASTGTYPPKAAVSYGGKVWVNQTGAWLNGSYVPGDTLHPFWSQQPSTAPIPWVVGMSLVKGMFVSNGGHVYQWASPDATKAPANWAPTGTVSTAAWTFTS